MTTESPEVVGLHPLRLGLCLGVIATVLTMSGCSRYRPVPLYPDQAWARIEAIRIEDLSKSEMETTDPTADFDYSDGLSEGEAASLAVVLNSEVRAFRMERGVANAQLIEAGLLPNPEIDTKWLTPPISPTQWAGEASALFDFTEALLSRGPRKARARIRVEEVRWEIADREWRLASETRGAFWDSVYFQEAIKLNLKQRELTEKTVLILRARKERGAGSELETLTAEIEQAKLELQAKRLAGEGKTALQTLNRLLGLPPNHATKLQNSINPLAYLPLAANREKLLENLRRSRPDLWAAEQAYLGSEKDLHLAHRKQFPRFALGPSYSGGDGERKGTFGLGFSFELPFFNRNQGEIALKTAQREQMRLQYVAKLQSARGEFHAVLTNLETLDGELKLFFTGIAPKLDRTLELTLSAFEKGELDVLQVVPVQERALETQRELLERLREFKRAQVDFARICGPGEVGSEGK